MEPSTSRSGTDSLGSDFFYGWDLLYKTVSREINKKADVLMVLAHFLLTKHYKFRCVGIGDDVSSSYNRIMYTVIMYILYIENDARR